MESTVTWVSGMSFSAAQDGHEIVLDAPRGGGGEDRGPSPKVLLLAGLGGCTAMDVVSILRKMQVGLDGLKVHVAADTTEEHPKVFRSIHVKYVFGGHGLPLDRLERAVSLSLEKYCGVGAMLSKACPITHEISLEGGATSPPP
jgi:putative redox protein